MLLRIFKFPAWDREVSRMPFPMTDEEYEEYLEAMDREEEEEEELDYYDEEEDE